MDIVYIDTVEAPQVPLTTDYEATKTIPKRAPARTLWYPCIDQGRKPRPATKLSDEYIRRLNEAIP